MLLTFGWLITFAFGINHIKTELDNNFGYAIGIVVALCAGLALLEKLYIVLSAKLKAELHE